MNKNAINYQADEFLRNSAPNPKTIAISKKISCLYDMCILTSRKGLPDYREHRLREILETYADEYAICRAMHPVIVGDITINEYLRSKELFI